MRRVINNPGVYNGKGFVDFTGGLVEWDFSVDKDLKFGTNYYSASAVEQLTATFVFTDTITNNNAVNVYQQFTDPAKDLVVWHYDICLEMREGNAGSVIMPYVCQMEDAGADSVKFHMLPHSTFHNGSSGTNMICKGEIVRSKESVAGAEDSNNLAFGLIIYNTSGANSECKGFISLNIYPITKPLKMIDPGV